MIVITRKENESFSVGEAIRIVVQQVKGANVRLSIEAPVILPVRALKRDALSSLPKKP
tara:strand:+ start:10369 stop:10542 length:174 start_codon:yes stop_codon:yes gene_type:complete